MAGDDGDTEVVGNGGASHYGYCDDGRPKTAAAGHLGDFVSISVEPGTCDLTSYQLPTGVYEVRYTSNSTYAFDGTYWNISDVNRNCFRLANLASPMGVMSVGADGTGSWTGAVPPGQSSMPGESGAICIQKSDRSGDHYQHPGIWAPYRLLAV